MIFLSTSRKQSKRSLHPCCMETLPSVCITPTPISRLWAAPPPRKTCGTYLDDCVSLCHVRKETQGPPVKSPPLPVSVNGLQESTRRCGTKRMWLCGSTGLRRNTHCVGLRGATSRWTAEPCVCSPKRTSGAAVPAQVNARAALLHLFFLETLQPTLSFCVHAGDVLYEILQCVKMQRRGNPPKMASSVLTADGEISRRTPPQGSQESATGADSQGWLAFAKIYCNSQVLSVSNFQKREIKK